MWKGSPVTAIEAVGLTKQYRGRRGPIKAIDSLDLEVPQGGVFGFLGANGAGKTTTIRAAVGLLRANRGTMRVLGAVVPDELPRVIDASARSSSNRRSSPASRDAATSPCSPAAGESP
jgi:ABC-type multidrug transport system ATPase subunit